MIETILQFLGFGFTGLGASFTSIILSFLIALAITRDKEGIMVLLFPCALAIHTITGMMPLWYLSFTGIAFAYNILPKNYKNILKSYIRVNRK